MFGQNNALIFTADQALALELARHSAIKALALEGNTPKSCRVYRGSLRQQGGCIIVRLEIRTPTGLRSFKAYYELPKDYSDPQMIRLVCEESGASRQITFLPSCLPGEAYRLVELSNCQLTAS